MPNPIIAEVTRGGIVESRHRGAYAVVDSAGRLVESAGDIETPVFPRSSIKAFQCLPVIESGAAGRYGLTPDEIALACASHTGEADHIRAARSMLAKGGNSEELYECGGNWPSEAHAHATAIRACEHPQQIHNECSGKHAGMLALARHFGVDPRYYVKREHPVQRAVAAAMGAICDCDLDRQPCGVDGCSVPTWAIPVRNTALGFARLCQPGHKAGRRIIAAVRAHPFMVAGTGKFDTEVMQAVPRLFTKSGAEGVQCACIPHAGLGIALKCDDGAGRAGKVAMAMILSRLDVWTPEETATLANFASHGLENWRHISVGELRAVS